MSPLEGILNIDKPGGMTSHDVVNRIRRLAGIRRVGHAGTLDPLATGVLLLGVGRATRLIEYLVGQPKTYEATLRLGQTTDTYDAEGTVSDERPFNHIAASQFQQALKQFRGPIQQRPPMYSAIKRQGQPLYKLARQGIDVDVPPRPVTIYALEMLAWDAPLVRLRATVSSGTYIRSLAHDLGQALGCGAHLVQLRRESVGSLGLDTAVPLADLDESNWQTALLPSDTAVAHLPRLEATDAEVQQLQQGQHPPRRANQPATPLTRAYAPDGRFIGIVTAHEKFLQARKIFYPLDSA